MLSRLRSFRLQLLAATAVTAIVGLLGANLAVGYLQNRGERQSDARKALIAAQNIARELAHGATLADVGVAQTVLPQDQVIVTRGGRVVFAGPSLGTDESEGVQRASFPGGVVTIRRRGSLAGDANAGTITAIVGLVAFLVVGVALYVSTVLSRRVRQPLDDAILVARRVGAGDYSARLGSIEIEEFAHFALSFDAMAARLEESDLEQRRFLADVAHELATPVNALVGFATALADGTADTPEERTEAAAMIAGESARLRSLIGDLRDLTRADLFESVHSERVRLDRFAAEMAARLHPLAENAGVEIELRPDSVEAVADPRVLESVVRNLLANAIQYTPRGGTITIWTERRGTEVALGVRDTGIGIAPEHRAHVFDRLYRADEARARTTGGSGLGLAIAQRAAAALGGRLELDSEVGRGSEFRLLLPRAGTERRRG